MKIILTIMMLTLPLRSFALLYGGVYGQLGFGDLKENNETVSSSQTLTHDGWTGHIGVGGRAGLSILFVTAGIVGDYSKVQWEGEREDSSIASVFDGAEDYDNVFERKIIGGFVKVDAPVLPIYGIVEYYSKISGQATYAEPRGENPFSQGDKFEGKGIGLGVGGSVSVINFTGILRQMTIDKYTLSGVEQSLPSSTFEKQKAWEISLQVGIALDIL